MNNLLLRPQIPHSKKLIDSIYLNGIAADMSATGTGKTFCAASIAKELNVPVVVICPKAVIPTWDKVMAKFGIKPLVIINYEKICRGNTKWLKYKKKEFYDKQHWETKGTYLHFPKNCLIIFDEVHKAKGVNSLNSNFLMACKNAGYKILQMSATAAMNPLEMKAYGFVMNLHSGRDFSTFCRNNGAISDGYGGLKIDIKSNVVPVAMSKIHNDIFNIQKTASRMTTEMFDGIFPENHIIAEIFDVGDNTEKINTIYNQMQEELDKLEKHSQNYRAHVFAIMMKARRKCELLKVPTMVEMIEDLYNEGISPVVFVNFTDSIAGIKGRLEKKKLGNTLSFIMGGQSSKERQTYIDEFQINKRKIMIANLSAGSVGISLHDLNGTYPRHTIINPSFSAVNLIQALGRCYRANGKSKVMQKIFFTANTIEEKAARRVQSKINNLSTLNDGDLIGDINFLD